MKFSLAILAALSVLPAQARVQAQEQAAPAPRPLYPVVRIYEWGTTLPDGTAEPMRRARPLGDIRDWILESDPELGMLADDPSLSGSVSVTFDIDAAGRATACRPGRVRGEPRLTAEVCDRLIGRLRMTPALDDNGTRVPDIAQFSVGYSAEPFRRQRLVENAPSAVLIEARRWPPDARTGRGRVTGLDLLPGGPTSPAAASEPWAGVEIQTDAQGHAMCRVPASSGDHTFNARACTAGGRATYDWTGIRSAHERKLEILFVEHQGQPRALPALQDASRPAVPPESLAAIHSVLEAMPGEGEPARLKVTVIIASDGRLVRCGVRDTSGSDTMDVAACALLREVDRFTPARDIFGRPTETYLHVSFAPPEP